MNTDDQNLILLQGDVLIAVFDIELRAEVIA